MQLIGGVPIALVDGMAAVLGTSFRICNTTLCPFRGLGEPLIARPSVDSRTSHPHTQISTASSTFDESAREDGVEKITQTELFRCMRRPSFYPHAPATVASRNTHISQVFLTGTYAYKVKRALALPFLDFSRLEDRRRLCAAEVSLNRRLARETYLGVIPIYWRDDFASLSPPGTVVEYAVQMRELKLADNFSHLLRRGRIDRTDVEGIAGRLAQFHATARRDLGGNGLGNWEMIGRHCRDNFQDAAGAVLPLSEDARFRAVAAVSTTFWRRREPLFRKREKEGRICEGHGDLRCEHVYLGPRPQIIDCIEFDETLRWGDVAGDLGFLLMDMDRHRAAGLANHLLATYAAATDDAGIYAVIDFYKCYRAMVRVKVNCLQLAAGGLGLHAAHRLQDATENLLDWAYAYAKRLNRPLLFVLSGLPASGKSTIAGRLAAVFDIPIYSSDSERKGLFSIPPTENRVSEFGKGIYSPAITRRTYAVLLRKAHRQLRQGGSLILDATYAGRRQRKGLLELARLTRCGLVVIHCHSPRRLLRERLEHRSHGVQRSDARLGHLDALSASFEPLEDLPHQIVLSVNTRQPLRETLLAILSHAYTRPWRQTLLRQRC